MKTAIIIALTISVCALAQIGTGVIQGTVTAEGAKPVAGALVTAVANGLPPASLAAQSGVDGGFQIQGLDPPSNRTLFPQVQAVINAH